MQLLSYMSVHVSTAKSAQPYTPVASENVGCNATASAQRFGHARY